MSGIKTHVLEASYRGANLRLEFDTRPRARLMINGLVREKRDAVSRQSATLKLGSTVQTDYEWHEFIEGIVTYAPGRITARLIANNAEVVSQTFDRQGGE